MTVCVFCRLICKAVICFHVNIMRQYIGDKNRFRYIDAFYILMLEWKIVQADCLQKQNDEV